MNVRAPRTLTFLAAFLLLPIAAQSAEPPKGAPPAVKPAPKLPPIYDPDVLGKKELEASADAAFKSGRRLFVDFGTNDCEPCRVLHDVIHERPMYENFARQFVLVSIDVTPGGPNTDLLKAYGIDPSLGLPAVAIFDSQARPLEITRSGEAAEPSKQGREAALAWLLTKFQKEPAK
jgi:thiol:disulfide interchange protein